MWEYGEIKRLVWGERKRGKKEEGEVAGDEGVTGDAQESWWWPVGQGRYGDGAGGNGHAGKRGWCRCRWRSEKREGWSRWRREKRGGSAGEGERNDGGGAGGGDARRNPWMLEAICGALGFFKRKQTLKYYPCFVLILYNICKICAHKIILYFICSCG